MGEGDSGIDRTLTDPAAPRASGEPEARSAGLVEIDPDRYEVEGEVARGGMGRILRAIDRRLDRPVAIKKLLDPGGGDRAAFEREARITARLQHPSIVAVYEAGQLPDGESFYAMKLVSGRSLKEAIADAGDLAGRMSLMPAVTRGVRRARLRAPPAGGAPGSQAEQRAGRRVRRDRGDRLGPGDRARRRQRSARRRR